jgi:hypothetical protein
VRQLGDFVLLEELGRGGMGVVYKARQESLQRLVALKVLPSFVGMDASSVARFRREAEAAARLAHPGIVPVYGVGEADGVHYYAMELVEGPSLETLLDRLRGRTPGRLIGSLAEESGIDQKYPSLKDVPGAGADAGARYPRSCAALIADVANALAVAHRSKIIHRDLKPSNVMIRNTGQPVLLDFGLARDERAVGLTRSGDAVGTPSYMAPEQAHGSKDLDARVDIYGLGATLYELLTLRPPFDGAHAGEIMRKILDEEVVPPRKLNPRVPEDLENIVLRCVAKDPERRYPAIEALEMDLRSFLAGGAVEARAPTRKERFLRGLRRNQKAAVVSFASLLAAGAVGVAAGVVSRHRAEADGLDALAQARVQLLQDRDVLKAKESYGRAQALLGDAAQIADARHDLAVEAFQRFYPEGEYDLLRRLFESIPEADRASLRELVERVEGCGDLRVDVAADGDAAAPSVTLKAFRNGSLAEEWMPLPEHGALPVGDYLLRAEAADRSPVLRRVTIGRDRRLELRVRLRPLADLPPGMVEVIDPDDGSAFAVAREEMSRGEYQAFLDALDDRALVQEMLPRGWLEQVEGGMDLPARGLSFRQARAAAARAGAHLLSEGEFRLAATAGLALRFPWGNQLDARRVAADPDQMSAPDPVGSHLDGASPLGVLNLLGNVAEILAPGRSGEIPLAGGHYQSPASALALDGRELVRTLASVDDGDAFCGTRLARFLPPPDQPELQRLVDARRREILESGASSLFHDWSIDETGAVSYSLTVSGVHQKEDPLLALELVTSGFLQIGDPTVRDGHDQVLTTQRTGPTHREASKLDITLARLPRRGQGYRVTINTWLMPASGITGDGDAFVLRIPVKAAGMLPIQHHVVLPPGSFVDEREPAPTQQYAMDGRIHLVWEFPPDQRGNRTIPAVVRFRRDGGLASTWPARGDVEMFRTELLRAIQHPRTARELVHPAYEQLPSGKLFSDVMSGRREALPDFGDTKLVDFTTVGSVVTLDLLSKWEPKFDGRSVRIDNWPVRMQAVRQGDRLQALRLAPRSRRDSGEVRSDGSYAHAGLKVSVQPNGMQVNRTQDELTEMQVKYERQERDGTLRFQILGHRARPGDTEDQMRVWLTGGAISLREGGAVPGSRTDTVGPDDERRLEGRSMHWLFPTAEGGWARERWTFVSKGLRHFLVKSVAEAPTRTAAVELFQAEAQWFTRMAESIRIE